jgi:uncharacterized repeat protein (TIGR02543 family)
VFRKTISFIGIILILLIVGGYQVAADAKLTEVIDLTGEYNSIATDDTKPLTAKGSIRVEGAEAATPWDVKVKVGQLKHTLTSASLGITHFKYQFNSGQMTNYLDNITEYRGDNVLSTSDSCLEQSQTLLRGLGSAAVNYSAVEAGFTVNNQATINDGVYYSKITYTFTTGLASTHSVVFDSQGGSSVATAQANHDGLVAKPADPTKDGYKFLGWTRAINDSTYFDFANDKILAKTTLYAQWGQPTITFKNYDGSAEIQPQGETSTSKQVPYNQAYSVPVAPAVDNQLFLGWSTVPNMTRGTAPILYVPTGIDYTAAYQATLNAPDQAYLGGAGDGTSFTATQDTTLYAVYIKTLPATTTPNANAPILEEFIWNQAVWRVIKVDGEKRLVIKVNPLTGDELTSLPNTSTEDSSDFESGDDSTLPGEVSFHDTQNTFYANADASTGYGESKLRRVLDEWLAANISGNELKQVLPVDLNLPTFDDLYAKYSSTGLNVYGGSDTGFNSWATPGWANYYKVSDFATTLTDITTNDGTAYQFKNVSSNAYQKQAFALSYGDIHTLADVSADSNKTNLLNFADQTTSNSAWLRGAGSVNYTAAFFSRRGNGSDSPYEYGRFDLANYAHQGNSSAPVRPALWLSLEAQHLVTFDSQGGSVVAGKSIKAGTALGELPTPTRSNYAFKGWFTDKDCSEANKVTSTTVVNADMKLYAKWEIQLKAGDYVKLADQAWRVLHVDPDKNQYLVTRENALTADELLAANPTYVINDDKGVYFKAMTDHNYYSSESDTGYGNSLLKTTIDGYYDLKIKDTADADKVLPVTLNSPTVVQLRSNLPSGAGSIGTSDNNLTHYTWSNFYKDTRFATEVNINGQRMAFALSHGDLNTTLGLTASNANSLLAFESKDDSTYKYWLRSGGDYWYDAAYVSGNGKYETGFTGSIFRNQVHPSLYLDLTKSIEKINPIHYVSDKGNNYGANPTWYTASDLPITLKEADRTAYTFGGWYQEKALQTPIITIDTGGTTSKVVAYAKWTPDSYTLKYNTDNPTAGDQIADIIKKAGVSTQHASGADLIKEGYSLKEWNTQQDGNGIGVNSVTRPYIEDLVFYPGTNGGITNLYAIWEARNDVTVSFGTNGGSTINPISTKYNAMITSPANPTKDGYTFEGWYADQTLKTKIDLTTKRFLSSTTLYAKWTPDTFTLNVKKDNLAWEYNNCQFYLKSTTDSSTYQPKYSKVGSNDSSVVFEAVPAGTYEIYANSTIVTATQNGKVITGNVAIANNVEYDLEFSTVTLANMSPAGIANGVQSYYAAKDARLELSTYTIPSWVNYTFGGFYKDAELTIRIIQVANKYYEAAAGGYTGDTQYGPAR